MRLSGLYKELETLGCTQALEQAAEVMAHVEAEYLAVCSALSAEIDQQSGATTLNLDGGT